MFNVSRNKVSTLSVKVMQVCPRIKFVTKQLHDLHRVMNIRTLQPIPSHVRFRDEKAKSDFLKNFSRRGIHSERQVVLSDFSNTNLPTVIYSKGWESLCGAPVTCPSLIIQEFYSNVHGFDYSIP